jgi:hypothetical protein
MTLVESVTVGSGGASSISFTSIPQDGTDLVLLISSRASINNRDGKVALNTGGTYTRRRLQGGGEGVFSDPTSADFQTATSSFTANTFGNASIYIPNYASSAAKSFSSDSVTENNETTAHQALIAVSWSETAAVTTVTVSHSTSFVENTTAFLYKITSGSDGSVVVS